MREIDMSTKYDPKEVEPGAYKRITDDYESREQAQRQYPMN